MKRILILIAAMIATPGISLRAEQISSVEPSGSWIYIYNSQGKKINTMSASTVGSVVGVGSDFFVSEKGSWIYIWSAEGKKINTLSKSTIGDVTGAAGNTFTSRKGSWIYTWSREGKKLNTRSAH